MKSGERERGGGGDGWINIVNFQMLLEELEGRKGTIYNTTNNNGLGCTGM